jgi:hypothetical protein
MLAIDGPAALVIAGGVASILGALLGLAAARLIGGG